MKLIELEYDRIEEVCNKKYMKFYNKNWTYNLLIIKPIAILLYQTHFTLQHLPCSFM